MLLHEGVVTCAVVRNPNSLCVRFVIGKVSTGMVIRGALWCGVANPEKIASDPVSKTAAVATASKTWFPKLSSGIGLWYPNNTLPSKQWHVTTLLSSTNSVCIATVGMSAIWGVPVPKYSLLLGLIFVEECIGKVIKWLSKIYYQSL